jgi:Short C-terminal domain
MFGTSRRVARRTSRRVSRRQMAMAGPQESYYEPPPQPSYAPPPPAAAPADPSYMAELEKLATMKQQGIITQEEFDAKKKQILGI